MARFKISCNGLKDATRKRSPNRKIPSKPIVEAQGWKINIRFIQTEANTKVKTRAKKNMVTSDKID